MATRESRSAQPRDHGLGEFLEGEVGEAHGNGVFAAYGYGKVDVLVG